GVDGVLGVGERLALGDVPDEALAVLGDRDHRRRGLVAAAIGNDDGRSVLDHGHAAVGRAQIDPDDLLSHWPSLLSPRPNPNLNQAPIALALTLHRRPAIAP